MTTTPHNSLKEFPFLQSVLDEIIPKDDVWERVHTFIGEITAELEKHALRASPSVGGSIAKNTWLKGDFDCDLFIRFEYDYDTEKISDLLEPVLHSFNAQRVHGSRDYFQVERYDMNFEIIPVLTIEKAVDAKNITDVSPLHVEWVRKYNLSDEIRLAKAFCKAQRVYGAESYIGGFSGHVIDILTIHYGSFANILRATESWKFRELIDVNKVHKGSLAQLNKAKIGPLNVIDPIQPERNAAAALTQEKVQLLKKAAQEFLANPSADFFVKVPFNIEEIKKKYEESDIVIIELGPTQGKKDIVGAKLLKCFEYISTQCGIYDFEIIASGWNWEGGSALLWYVFDPEPKPEKLEKKGPPLKQKKHVASFKQKHAECYEKDDGFLYTIISTPYRTGRDLITTLLIQEYISQKTTSTFVQKS